MSNVRTVIRAHDDSETTVREIMEMFLLEKRADGRSEKTKKAIREA